MSGLLRVQLKVGLSIGKTKRQIETFRFADKGDDRHPTISQAGRRHRDRIIPFLAYPPEIRRAIYTTNAIESLNRSLHKVTRHRGSFPHDEAALKLLYLALRNISRK